MDVGNVLGSIVWFVAAFACLVRRRRRQLRESVLLRARSDRELASLAVLYLLLSAEFVAAAQVLVYAGAVMVMFLFGDRHLGGRADAPWAGAPTQQQIAAVSAAAPLVEVVIAVGLKAGGRPPTRRPSTRSSAARTQIGTLFLTDHLLAFEITSIVLLVAAVGGVILGAPPRRLNSRAHR